MVQQCGTAGGRGHWSGDRDLRLEHLQVLRRLQAGGEAGQVASWELTEDLHAGMLLRKIIPGILLGLLAASTMSAQDLAPRAYVITPKSSNAVTVTWSFYTGGLDFNGAIPVSDARGTYNVPVLTYYHSFGFFGRSANFNVSLPYAVGNFTGELNNQQRSVYRSGLLDFNGRLSVNLYGGRAMPVKDFRKWKQKVIPGASLRIVAPTGQYDPT